MQRPCGKNKHGICEGLNSQCGQEEGGGITCTICTVAGRFLIRLSQLAPKVLVVRACSDLSLSRDLTQSSPQSSHSGDRCCVKSYCNGWSYPAVWLFAGLSGGAYEILHPELSPS